MTNNMLIDNWTLQDVKNSFTDGLMPGISSSLISIEKNSGKHSWQNLPYGCLQIESLFVLLTTIVLCDELILDEAYNYTWKSQGTNPFVNLEKQDYFQTIQFDSEDVEYKERKSVITKHLCPVVSLKQACDRVTKGTIEDTYAEDQYAMQIIGGTARYLTYGDIKRIPYSAHPARRCLLEETAFSSPSSDIISDTVQWINSKRIKLFREVNPSIDKRGAIIVLPPIVSEIIQASSSLNDLVESAIQIRSNYSWLREWLREYRNAIDDEDPNALLKHKKVLDAVASDLDKRLNSTEPMTASITLAGGLIQLPLRLPNPNRIVRHIGIRGALNRQLFSPAGKNSLEKLLGMFGEEKSCLGSQVFDHLAFHCD